MGVIDILPGCVSSVYFMYDTTWERFSLGKVSLSRSNLVGRLYLDLHRFYSSAPFEKSLWHGICKKLAHLKWDIFTWVCFSSLVFPTRRSYTLCQGFYIYSCPKMRYKGEYAPSYLADPVSSRTALILLLLLIFNILSLGNI